MKNVKLRIILDSIILRAILVLFQMSISNDIEHFLSLALLENHQKYIEPRSFTPTLVRF